MCAYIRMCLHMCVYIQVCGVCIRVCVCVCVCVGGGGGDRERERDRYAAKGRAVRQHADSAEIQVSVLRGSEGHCHARIQTHLHSGLC